VIFTLTMFILFSGCVEESKVTQSNESVYRGSVNLTPENVSSAIQSPEAENIPEIQLKSLSSIYMRDNHEKVYDYLFCWDNVPGSENQGLISYLRDNPDIGREDIAQIVKSDDNKTIRVYFTSSISTKLRVEDNKGNILSTPDVELKVKKVNGKYKVLMTPQTPHYFVLEGKEVNGKLCIYTVNEKTGFNITERYYAVYGLSIKNNGSKDLDFKLNELHVRDGDHIFNTTIEPEYLYYHGSDVLSDLEKENKLENTTLSPGETINGSVVFQVNSLYNKSFLLMYNGTPIPSTSFDKSFKALSTAEQYDYSIAFGIPPYNNGFNDSFEYSDTFSNWVNRSIFEVFKDAYPEHDANWSTEYLPETELIYALEVIPATNITLLPVSSSSYEANHLLVVDDTGEELINTSIDKIAIFKNQTYELQSPENLDSPQIIDNSQMKMNFSNVTIVRISFWRDNWHSIFSRINQNVIVDKQLKIVAASNKCINCFS